MADIAMAAGFGSIRRFNAVMQRTYARRAAESTRDIPVLFMTAKADEAFDSGAAQGVIAKPFELGGLADEVAARLGWSS